MGLLSKVKNILFEEDEIEIPIISSKEEPIIETEKKILNSEENKVEKEIKMNNISFDNTTISPEEKKQSFDNTTSFTRERKFDFPIAFDEEERIEPKPVRKSTNVLEYQKREKRMDFGEKPREERKFKPTPVISPVFGIVDKRASKEELLNSLNGNNNQNSSKTIDIDAVRRKAYGKLEDDIEDSFEKSNTDFFDYKKNSNKTIDELMKEAADEEITLGRELIIDDYVEKNKPQEKNLKEPIIDDTDELEYLNPNTDEFNRTDDIKIEYDEDITEEIKAKRNPIDELNDIEKDLTRKKTYDDIEQNDTIETDLFNLIDSMYDNREDGE